VKTPDRESRVNPHGNERLTAAVGLLVIVPVLVEIATILLGVHTFMSLHVFVGLALIPAVLLKLASTGWRFVRYYTRSHGYVALGPPQLAMRLLAPLFVAATVVLFGSGVAMGLLHGHALELARRLHGPSSVVWLVLLGLHVLVYLRRALSRTAQDALATKRAPLPGTSARVAALALVVICGVAVGAATVPAQHRWVYIRRGGSQRRAGLGRWTFSFANARIPPNGAIRPPLLDVPWTLIPPASTLLFRPNRLPAAKPGAPVAGFVSAGSRS
jgi:hypothetical protein